MFGSLANGSPRRWASTLIAFMDAIALFAVFSTGEARTQIWVVVAAVAGVRSFRAARLGVKGLSWVVGLLVLGAAQLYLNTRDHPVIIAAHLLPLVHAALWLGEPSRNYRGWRVGIGFIELIVAAALTPDFLLPILIFAFIVLGSVSLSCSFLDQELRRRAPLLVQQALPQRFIQRGVIQAMLVLLTSAVIFPFLPRFNTNLNPIGTGGNTTTGYTEQVNLAAWTQFTEEGASSIALRAYAEDENDFAAAIPLGLLRTRVLPLFDGSTWNPAPRQAKPKLFRGRTGKLDSYRLSILRERIGSPSLPVPYGTGQVVVDVSGYGWQIQPTTSEEWATDRRSDQRTRYSVQIGKETFPEDEPSQIHLYIPPQFRKTRLEQLAQNLFRTARTDKEKIQAVRNFFKAQEFKPSMNFGSKKGDGTSTPLEEFLFKTREGHCELFSGATALLLRMGGVPTRLIAGFRITRMPVGNVLTVRMSDAHAWVEAYRPEIGWFPLDLTPRLTTAGLLSSFFRDGYDWMSAQWYRYIVTYDESALTMFSYRRWKNWLFPKSADGTRSFPIEGDWVIFVGVLFAGGILTAIIGLRRRWLARQKRAPREGIPVLRKERRAFERLNRGTPPENPESSRIREDWQELYADMRFSRQPTEDAGDDRLERLRELRQAYSRSVSEAKPE